MTDDFDFVGGDLGAVESSILRRRENRLVELRSQLLNTSNAPSAWRFLGDASYALFAVRQELAGRVQA